MVTLFMFKADTKGAIAELSAPKIAPAIAPGIPAVLPIIAPYTAPPKPVDTAPHIPVCAADLSSFSEVLAPYLFIEERVKAEPATVKAEATIPPICFANPFPILPLPSSVSLALIRLTKVSPI